MKLFILIMCFLPLINPAQAFELETIFAGNHHKVAGANAQHGFSTNIRLIGSSKGSASGFYLLSKFPGINIGIFDAILGYTFRSKGKWYVEGGGGFRYARIWGAGFAINAGFGFRISNKWHVALPVYYRLGFSIEYVPYIGYRF